MKGFDQSERHSFPQRNCGFILAKIDSILLYHLRLFLRSCSNLQHDREPCKILYHDAYNCQYLKGWISKVGCLMLNDQPSRFEWCVWKVMIYHGTTMRNVDDHFAIKRNLNYYCWSGSNLHKSVFFMTNVKAPTYFTYVMHKKQ